MLDIEPIKTDLITLLQNSINAIKPSAEKKNIQLLLSIDPDMPRFADIDPIRLKQVLANLLSNGVKFTEKGEVELKVRFNPLENKKGRLSFSIRDTGIGINDEEKNKLFKAFSQADSSTTRKYGGTGLGLILSDLITDKMGSKIQFISTPNIGTTFFFDIITTVHEDGDYLLQQNSDTFPPETWRLSEAETRRLSVAETRRLSEAETRRLSEAETRRLSEAETWRLSEAETLAVERSRNLDQERMDPKIRILIADDVKLNLVIVKAVLTRNIEQVEVFEASNGSEAVDLYKQHPIDLIVMDVMMPECDGLEATRQIREIESGTGNHTPIIALTAGALKEEREKCFAAGMDDFLAKPVDPEMTMAVIKRYLRL